MPIKDLSSTQTYINPDTDVINLVNRIINNAIKEGASDIHIEPGKDKLIVRIRVNGILKVLFEIPKDLTKSLISRIKVMTELDTTGAPRPQEGSIKVQIADRDIDLRISIFPIIYGECVVMRILESINKYENFEDLGFSVEQAEMLEGVIHKPFGLILVTGPVGGGKSTTLFSILNKLNEPTKSLVTLEDPVERKMDHVRQTQINPEVGLTFASGLHFQLRQDVNVIMVGEIRDPETANIAIQAAMTGQLVLATIHANSAAGVIVRLLGMGIEPYLIVSALKLVTSQRLARINCPHCRRETVPPLSVLHKMGVSQGTKFFNSNGCDKCGGKGVVGRFGIHEVLRVSDRIKEAIYENYSESKIVEIAKSEGMALMKDIVLQRAEEGTISLEEAMRLAE